MKNKTIILSTLVATLLSARVFACEFCGCELPILTLEDRKGWYLGASEQYTSAGTLSMDSHTIPNVGGQYLNSSVTQVYFGYNMGHALGVQMNLPMIYRSYQRVEAGAIQRGDVSGIGDISFLLHWTPLRIDREDLRITGRVFGGFSLPTGDNHRVREEGDEGAGTGAEGGILADVPSGVHGHDLALGTGSVNGIFGADIHLQWKRAFLDAGVVGTICGPGRNDYDFSNFLNWYANIGAVAVDRKDFVFTCALAFSGGTKGEDSFRGVESTDTASTVVYIGPKVSAKWRQRLHVDFGVGFPILNQNTGVAVVPDYQIQASVGFRF